MSPITEMKLFLAMLLVACITVVLLTAINCFRTESCSEAVVRIQRNSIQVTPEIVSKIPECKQ